MSGYLSGADGSAALALRAIAGRWCAVTVIVALLLTSTARSASASVDPIQRPTQAADFYLRDGTPNGRKATVMARFRCVCGELIVTSGDIPNPIEWRCLSDCDFDDFAGMVNVENVYARTTIMYRCPASDHLWFFWDGIEAPPRLYAPQPVHWREG